MGCLKLTYSQEKETTFLKVWKNPETTSQKVGCLDYGHRMYDPAIARFTTQDRFAEEFGHQSPYVYAANNPVLLIDIMGDSATFQGAAAQDAINFMNTQLAGFYTFAMDANGNVSMTQVQQQNGNGQQNANGQNGNGQQPQMSAEQQELANQLNTVINGNGMTTVNFTMNDQNTLVGDITTGTVDMGDVQAFGNGQYVDQAGAFIHEVHEQYQVQVVNQGQQTNANNWNAHRRATAVEGRVTGSVSNPMRPSTPNAAGNGGTVTVPVWDATTNQWHNVTIQYQNNNVTGVTR